MKVNARNVFSGTVSAHRPGGVTAEVEADIGGGAKLVAIITLDSAQGPGPRARRWRSW